MNNTHNIIDNPEDNHHQLLQLNLDEDVGHHLSDVEYLETQVFSVASNGNGIHTKDIVDLRITPNSLRDRQIDMMTDDLRRSIERLDKVIEKSQFINNKSSSSTHHNFSLSNKAAGRQSKIGTSVAKKSNPKLQSASDFTMAATHETKLKQKNQR